MKKFLNADVIFGTIMLVICGAFYSMGMQLASVGLKGGIDAGFFPRMLTVIVAVMSVGLIIAGIAHPKSYFSIDEQNKPGIRLIIGTLMIFSLYIALWKLVHFIPLTLVFLLAMSWLLKLSWKFSVIYSTIMSFGLFYIFASVFKIILN